MFESIERHPVQYLPTGDRALLIAWAVLPLTVAEVTVNEVHVTLCLEDGTAVSAPLSQIKFDYRYDLANDRWVDVSRVSPEEGQEGANADQEAGDHGSPEVP